MQRLLTEEEYQELVGRAEAVRAGLEETIQALCIRVAEHEPVDLHWEGDGTPPRPWGCILKRANSHEYKYCDHCPVKLVCPYPGKNWNK